MTQLSFDDLPPALQQQVRSKLGMAAIRGHTPKRRTTRRQVPAAECHGGGTCSCGLEFTSFNRYEKHRRTTPTGRHGRYSLTLTSTDQVTTTAAAGAKLAFTKREEQ